MGGGYCPLHNRGRYFPSGGRNAYGFSRCGPTSLLSTCWWGIVSCSPNLRVELSPILKHFFISHADIRSRGNLRLGAPSRPAASHYCCAIPHLCGKHERGSYRRHHDPIPIVLSIVFSIDSQLKQQTSWSAGRIQARFDMVFTSKTHLDELRWFQVWRFRLRLPAENTKIIKRGSLYDLLFGVLA